MDNKEKEAVMHSLELFAEMQFKFAADVMSEGGLGVLAAYTLTHSQVYCVESSTFSELHKKNAGIKFDEGHLPKVSTTFFIEKKDGMVVFVFDKNREDVNLFVGHTEGKKFRVFPIYFHGKKAITSASFAPGVSEEKIRLMREQLDKKQIEDLVHEFFYFCECLHDCEVIQEKVELDLSSFAMSAFKAVYGVGFTPRDVIVLE